MAAAELKFSGSSSLIRIWTPKASSISLMMETTSNESRMPSSMSSVSLSKSTSGRISFNISNNFSIFYKENYKYKKFYCLLYFKKQLRQLEQLFLTTNL